jgi:predicted nuclease of predicted toxin-antitoxin system
MNLSPEWIPFLKRHGWESVHWADVGDRKAADEGIMRWAESNGHIVFTHDLDFGTLLALTRQKGPSVIQVRSQDVSPSFLGPHVILALQQFQQVLSKGAILVVEEDNTRVRLLPLSPSE